MRYRPVDNTRPAHDLIHQFYLTFNLNQKPETEMMVMSESRMRWTLTTAVTNRQVKFVQIQDLGGK